MSRAAPENETTAEVQTIYNEVKRLYGVPYVSAIHRSLATQPGFLEWAWAEVAPAFRSGAAQEAGWAAAELDRVPGLAPMTWPALRAWGLDARDVASVRTAAETFLRVAPVNMMFAALLKLRLEGSVSPQAGEAREPMSWLPPAELAGSPPEMVDLDHLDEATRELALLFASELDGEPFIPGFYRMLLHWPAFAAHVATVLLPYLRGVDALAAFDELRRRIDEAAPSVLAAMPAASSTLPPPSQDARAYFSRISATYRKTSPELVIAGWLVLEALPTPTE